MESTSRHLRQHRSTPILIVADFLPTVTTHDMQSLVAGYGSEDERLNPDVVEEEEEDEIDGNGDLFGIKSSLESTQASKAHMPVLNKTVVTTFPEVMPATVGL